MGGMCFPRPRPEPLRVALRLAIVLATFAAVTALGGLTGALIVVTVEIIGDWVRTGNFGIQGSTPSSG